MLQFRYPDKPITSTVDFASTLNTHDYLAQAKYDGWRMLVYIDGANELRFFSRSGSPMQDRFEIPPEIEARIIELALPDNTVLDTELVGPRGDHKTKVCIFDCLAYDGKWLCKETYRDRWNRCLALQKYCLRPGLQLATTVTSDGTVYDYDAPEGGVRTLHMTGNPFVAYFNILKANWQIKRDMDLYEGIVLKHLQGKLQMSLTRCTETAATIKCKYRDIKNER